MKPADRHAMTVMEALVNRALFGGALEIACPQRFQDISDFRSVPDHQEVGMPPTVLQGTELARNGSWKTPGNSASSHPGQHPLFTLVGFCAVCWSVTVFS